MCGRYELDTIKKELWERYHIVEENNKWFPKAEVFPTDVCPVVIEEGKIVMMKWGFIESFSKKPLINARAETILQKPTFRDSFLHSRCIIPVTAFFEWEEVNGKKMKRKISVENMPIVSLAGIKKSYSQPDGSLQERFSIITTNSSKQIEKIHDRMPVILSPKDEESYLNHQLPASEVTKLLIPTKETLIIE